MRTRRPLEDRLWERIERTPGCWLWKGQLDHAGYGRIGAGGRGGRPLLVHRLTYELMRGPIPAGAVIDHMCRNPLCCNPDHLQAVSNGINLQNQSGVYKNSKTGVRGVFYDRRRGTYQVRACVDGRRRHRGGFHSLQEAERAAVELRNELMTNNLLDRATEVEREGRNAAITTTTRSQ